MKVQPDLSSVCANAQSTLPSKRQHIFCSYSLLIRCSKENDVLGGGGWGAGEGGLYMSGWLQVMETAHSTHGAV